MHTPSARPATARNPVARSLALAVLSLALAGIVVLGGVMVAALAALVGLGYLASLLHRALSTRQSRARMRRRAFAAPQPATADAILSEARY